MRAAGQWTCERRLCRHCRGIQARFSRWRDGRARYWMDMRKEAVPPLWGHTGPVFSLAGWQGKALSGLEDSSIRVWDAGTGAHEATLAGHDCTVHGLAVHGSRLFSASYDGTGMGSGDVGGSADGGGARAGVGATPSVSCRQRVPPHGPPTFPGPRPGARPPAGPAGSGLRPSLSFPHALPAGRARASASVPLWLPAPLRPETAGGRPAAQRGSRSRPGHGPLDSRATDSADGTRAAGGPAAETLRSRPPGRRAGHRDCACDSGPHAGSLAAVCRRPVDALGR
jgi:hypothetical protein